MPSLPRFLSDAWDHRAKILAAAVVFLLAVAQRQRETIVRLSAAPTVTATKTTATAKVVQRAAVHRAPVKTTKTVTTAKDGVKTVVTVKEAGPVDVGPVATTTTALTAETRVETPPPPPKPFVPTRYVGLGLDPFAPGIPKRVRAGLTLWNRIDVGVAWEPRLRASHGAVGVELSYRF